MEMAERINDVLMILIFVKENTKNTSMNSIKVKRDTRIVYAALRLLTVLELPTSTEKRIAITSFKILLIQ